MAITFVAGASAVRTSNGTNIVVNKPSGVQEGDVLVAVVGVVQETVTNPSGWTTLNTQNQGTAARIQTAWKPAGSSEPSTYQFDLSASQDDVAASIAAFRGCDDADPIRDNAGTSSANVSSLASPSLTGTQATDMVVIFGGGRPNASGADNECTAPNASGWTAAPGCHSGDSDPGAFPQSTDIAYQINGGTGTFTYTAGTNACTAAVSLIEGDSGVSGTLGVVAPGVEAALSGAVEVSGTLDMSAPGAEASFSGAVEVSGTLDATAPGVEASLGGVVGASGALDMIVPGAEVGLGGAVAVSGTLDGTVPGPALDMTGSTDGTVLDVVAPVPTADFSAAAEVSGTLGATAPISPVVFDAAAEVSGSLGATVPAVGVSLSGTASSGAVSGSLGAVAPSPVVAVGAAVDAATFRIDVEPEERLTVVLQDKPVELFEV